MAKVDIQYNCGCQFITRDLEAAKAHCDTKFHDMSVHGIIHHTTQAPPRYEAPVRRPSARVTLQKPAEPSPEAIEKQIHNEFSSLKDRLKRRA